VPSRQEMWIRLIYEDQIISRGKLESHNYSIQPTTEPIRSDDMFEN
jgi:hypothetical protein